jgi:hypothetical protein
MKWGIRLFILAEIDTGYVHSIIPKYGKLTGDKCNLPYSEKPFKIVIFLMDKLGLTSVCLVLKTTSFSLAVLSWPKNLTIENVSTHFDFSLHAPVAQTFWTKPVT